MHVTPVATAHSEPYCQSMPCAGSKPTLAVGLDLLSQVVNCHFMGQTCPRVLHEYDSVCGSGSDVEAKFPIDRYRGVGAMRCARGTNLFHLMTSLFRLAVR
jgi:hypothetical protein